MSEGGERRGGGVDVDTYTHDDPMQGKGWSEDGGGSRRGKGEDYLEGGWDKRGTNELRKNGYNYAITKNNKFPGALLWFY